MGFWHALTRIVGRGPDHDGDGTHISTNARRALLYHEGTRGVDLPTWHTPDEIEQMRRVERRFTIIRRRSGTEG